MEVRLMSFMDNSIAATQVCQNSQNPEEALPKALKQGHLSLLEHQIFTYRIEGISRACSHQLVRHRIASYTQQSQRYVKLKENWYVVPLNIQDFKAFHSLMHLIEQSYNDMLKRGVPLEDARSILPNCTKTSLIMTINGRSLDNFLTLRTCSKAQSEIRILAKLMYRQAALCSEFFETTNYPKCLECKNPCKEKINYDC